MNIMHIRSVTAFFFIFGGLASAVFNLPWMAAIAFWVALMLFIVNFFEVAHDQKMKQMRDLAGLESDLERIPEEEGGKA